MKHYKELGDGRQVVLHGMISEGSLASDPPRLKDLVRVKVTLSRPAYSYLIALNPNGTIQLFAPIGGIVPNSPRPELDFPEDPGNYFALTDGVGLQAFVVVASDRSLPVRVVEDPGPQRLGLVSGGLRGLLDLRQCRPFRRRAVPRQASR